jgi:hypothetical protein
MTLVKRTVRQRLAANELWQRNQIALLRDSQTVNTTRREQDMEPTPQERAERERWNQGVGMIDKINAARSQTGEEPLVVNQENAPDAVKEEAKRQQQALNDLAESSYKRGRAEAERDALDRRLRDLGGDAA